MYGPLSGVVSALDDLTSSLPIPLVRFMSWFTSVVLLWKLKSPLKMESLEMYESMLLNRPVSLKSDLSIFNWLCLITNKFGEKLSESSGIVNVWIKSFNSISELLTSKDPLYCHWSKISFLVGSFNKSTFNLILPTDVELPSNWALILSLEYAKFISAWSGFPFCGEMDNCPFGVFNDALISLVFKDKESIK